VRGIAIRARELGEASADEAGRWCLFAAKLAWPDGVEWIER